MTEPRTTKRFNVLAGLFDGERDYRKILINDYGCRPEDIKSAKMVNGFLDVVGHVILRNKNLTKIPFTFGKVSGGFDISYNGLKDLYDSPRECADFNCSNNSLKTLWGAPSKVHGDFSCSHNRLTSVYEAMTIEVDGDFFCQNNLISEAPQKLKSVKGKFHCDFKTVASVSNTALTDIQIAKSDARELLENAAEASIGPDGIEQIKLKLRAIGSELSPDDKAKWFLWLPNAYKVLESMLEDSQVQKLRPFEASLAQPAEQAEETFEAPITEDSYSAEPKVALVEICPMCSARATGRCKCRIGSRTCKCGCQWYMKDGVTYSGNGHNGPGEVIERK